MCGERSRSAPEKETSQATMEESHMRVSRTLAAVADPVDRER
jgi:hypothetical protein